MADLELQYEPSVAARPVLVEREAGITRIIVPVQRWLRIPIWLSDLIAAVFRTAERLPQPRAVFEVSEDRIKVWMQSETQEGELHFDWPRHAVIAIRPNRYSSGLWVDVAGHVKDTYLTDLSAETIEKISEALKQAMDVRPSA